MLPHWLIQILSQRLVADAYTRCDKVACAYFVAAIRRTNSNQFEFVRQIAATKFCRSDNDFTRGDLLQQPVAATCRSDLSHRVSRPSSKFTTTSSFMRCNSQARTSGLTASTHARNRTLPDLPSARPWEIWV